MNALPSLLVLMNCRKNFIEFVASIDDNYKFQILRQIILRYTNNTIPKIENYVTEVIPNFSCQTFKQNFRITEEAFELLLQHLIPHWEREIQREPAEGGNEHISLKKTLLIALWIFATPDSYRSVGERFNVGKSRIYRSVQRSIYLINTHLCPKFIKWPAPEEREFVAQAFEEKSGLPPIIGAIEGCHIPIRRPVHNGNDYYNRKRFYSVVLQGICKADLSLIDVDCRWPGSFHDARVFRTSPIYQVIEQLCEPHFMIIGDVAYPVHSCVLPPFKNNPRLTRQQTYYNTVLSKTRVCIENAFALLKGRFRRLKYLEMYDIEEIVNSVICCCTLHNVCLEDDIQQFLEEGRDDVHLIHNNIDYIGHDNDDGNNIRNHIVYDTEIKILNTLNKIMERFLKIVEK